MSTLFIYMVKVAVYLIALYLIYSLLLSRDTSYSRNRAFILTSIVLAFVLPFVNFQTIRPMGIQFFGRFLSDVFVSASAGGSDAVTSGSGATDYLRVIYSVYIIGVIALVLKLFVDLLNLFFLILKQRNTGSRIIRFHGFNTSGFSAMGYIFINTRLNPEDAGQIIRHEQNHLKQNHFIDIIFIETIKAFQWFNPVVYLFNRSLRAIHEYQADQECLSSGVPMVNYQSLLLNQVFKSSAFNLTNSFSNPSLVKRRMIMMTKKRTSALANMKLLIVVPVVGLVFLAISAYREIPNIPDKQAVPVTLNKELSSSGLISATSKVSPDLSGKSLNQAASNASRSTATNVPPPPPPPPPSGLNEGNSNTSEEVADKVEIDPYVAVEVMPKFPGGETELLRYIAEHTNYPETAKANSIQGRVIIRFCVTDKGGISMISVLKGVDPALDTEAMRVVSTLPAFNPGKQGGKEVPVWYMVPITFTLN